jgi:hypothetical protein
VRASVAADAVVIVHFAFVLFAIFGGLLALRWRWTPLVHLPALAWGVYVELSGSICPLTPLENRLRAADDGAVYAGGFIEHHLEPLLYPAGLSTRLQFAFAAGLVAINLLIYGLVAAKRARETRRSGTVQ